MTASFITNKVAMLFSNHKYALTNSYIFDRNWECDYFSVSNSNYYYEVEVKISRSDFKADFKKPKHEIFSNAKKPTWVKTWSASQFVGYITTSTNRLFYGKMVPHTRQEAQYKQIEKSKVMETAKIDFPHKFYYAVPENMITVDEVPKYAGLIYVRGTDAIIVKQAPFLHKNKMDLKQTLLDKFYYECVTHRNSARYRNSLQQNG